MTLPAPLAEIVDDFAAVDGQDKLQLLLEFSRELPPIPAELEEAAMEPVPECQSPLFLSVDTADREHVRLHFSAPPRPRPPAASRPSCIRGSTASVPNRSSRSPTTSTRPSAWPKLSARCACEG
ncbi:cysteine desufuration protein SufE [Rhodococcus ruber]|nr:cysteine desufuration protein SufE [Rhodococcus ruber]